MTAKIKDIAYEVLAWLPVIGLLMVISAIPYGWSAYQRIGCYVLVSSYAVWWLATRQWCNFQWDKSKWLYVVIMALWAMLPIRQLFDATPPTDYYLRQVHLHAWFLYTGIIGILGFSDKLKLRHVAYVMLATSVVMLAHCAHLYFGTTEYGEADPFMRLNILRRTTIHSHMVTDLYANTALILGFVTLRRSSRRWEQSIIGIAMVLTWLLILLSEGRIGMITSMLIVGVSVMYFLFQKSRIAAIGSGALIVLMAIVAYAHHPHAIEMREGGEPRIAVWDYSWRMGIEKPICGYGLSTLSEEYVKKMYTDPTTMDGFIVPIIYHIPDFASQGKTMDTHHPHNAFLMYWLAVGIIGVLLLVALFVLAALLPMGSERIFLWLFLLALFLQCLLEPIGAHLLPQFIAVMLFVWENVARHASRADNS
ncbi:MAG: O-antigen ligase family protein [Paludibacteraceae bacterium]|nr:O-antigen ligase family protein [Paludibacteraceae bacterium]